MNYDFKVVTIGKMNVAYTKLTKIEQGKECEGISDIQKKICIIDDLNQLVDIENFDIIYPTLDTNKYGLILPNQKVEKGKYYALKSRSVSKEDLSLLQSTSISRSYTKYKKRRH